eukprot:scaffold3855_cov108-Isochrysis_galbana.AAC.6
MAVSSGAIREPPPNLPPRQCRASSLSRSASPRSSSRPRRRPPRLPPNPIDLQDALPPIAPQPAASPSAA